MPLAAVGLPMTRAVLEFALERHAGQLRGDHYAPFVQHPLEVASLLSLAGYEDAVVASGVLHDVLENTYTDVGELEDRFGETVAALVQAVSEHHSRPGPQVGAPSTGCAELCPGCSHLRCRQGLEGA
jgi:(p)ppGpp synthase/HD superfamily hydrolase